MNQKIDTPQTPRIPIPQGYRQGLITAITVFLAFSLGFFRFWAFEEGSEWTVYSVSAAVFLLAAIFLQITALFRALRIIDDHQPEYTNTVRLFVCATAILIFGVLFASLAFSGIFQSKDTSASKALPAELK